MGIIYLIKNMKVSSVIFALLIASSSKVESGMALKLSAL